MKNLVGLFSLFLSLSTSAFSQIFEGQDAQGGFILKANWTDARNHNNFRGVAIPYQYDLNLKTGSPPSDLQKEGYTLFWHDEFEENLSSTRLNVSGTGCWNCLESSDSVNCNPDNPNFYARNSPECPHPDWDKLQNLITQQKTKWIMDIGLPPGQPNKVPENVDFSPYYERTQLWYPGTSDYVHTEKGYLVVKSTKEEKTRIYQGEEQPYWRILSGQLVSTLLFRYGYYEARIKIPRVQGGWSALWAYNNWPEWSEIDMPEFFTLDVSNRAKNDFHSFHSSYIYKYSSPDKSGGVNYYPEAPMRIFPTLDAKIGARTLDLSADYFLYGVEWSPDSIIQYINGVAVHRLPNLLQAREPMNLLMGMGFHDETDIENPLWGSWPNYFLVDYVRIYKNTSRLAEELLEFLPSKMKRGESYLAEIYDFSPQYEYVFEVEKTVQKPLNAEQKITYKQRHKHGGIIDFYVPVDAPKGIYEFRLRIKEGEKEILTTTKSVEVQ